MRIICFIILSTLSLTSLKLAKNVDINKDAQIVFSQNFYEAIKTLNCNFIDSNYLTKEQFVEVRNQSGDALADSKSEKFLLNFEEDKKYYLKNITEMRSLFYAQMGGYDSLTFTDVRVDSISYEYAIKVKEGRDIKILWPESRDYLIPEGQMVFCSSIIWLEERGKTFALFFQVLRYKNEWKFFRSLRSARIVRLK